MAHPRLTVLIGVVAVFVGVAIAALTQTIIMPAHPGGSLSLRQPILWVAVLIPAVLIMIILLLRWRRETR